MNKWQGIAVIKKPPKYAHAFLHPKGLDVFLTKLNCLLRNIMSHIYLLKVYFLLMEIPRELLTVKYLKK